VVQHEVKYIRITNFKYSAPKLKERTQKAKSFEKITVNCQPLARRRNISSTSARSQHSQEEPTKSFPVNTRQIPS